MNDLFQIIRSGNYEEFTSKLSLIDINVINAYHQNLLEESITCGVQKISEYLIKQGINLDHQDINGKTPLHYCAEYDDKSIAAFILQNGGDVNVKDKYGNNPLWTAVFNENYQIVQLYVDNNGDINNKNGNNMSPLDFAIELADTTLIEILTLKNNISHT